MGLSLLGNGVGAGTVLRVGRLPAVAGGAAAGADTAAGAGGCASAGAEAATGTATAACCACSSVTPICCTGSAARRTPEPLIIQAVRGTGSLRSSSAGRAGSARRQSRPANSGASCSGTPATRSCPTAASRPCRPLPSSSATARCGRPSRMRPVSLASTLFGPTSTNTRAPSACMASISATNSTGLTRCSAISFLLRATSAGCGRAVALAYTGTVVRCQGVASIRSDSAFCAGFTRLLADLTAKRYQDELILPDPNHSGTGATILQAVFDGYGTKAEDVLRQLIERTRLFTANGFAPTSYVASGEAILGVNFIGDQQSLREKYYPVKSIPLDTYSINAISKLKGRTQQKQANAFMRFVLSSDGQAILRKVSFGTPTYAIAKTQPIQQNIGQDIVADYRDYLRRFNQLQDK